MRIFLTVVGMVALFFTVAFAMVLGIMAFTPTQSCAAGATTGACAYGQLPMMLMLFGPIPILVATSLATWIRTPNGPRAYWPWIGVALVVGLFVSALGIAQG
ncbi:hypothetical protein Lesp02_69600 [Lentzea sp. NBRC 105346]|uniref:hypothetical protein n=1 Tax=Lentzea sp. NBRC 105346 TaxID=3032205 RepID=UPI0024A1AC9C|nr:hypothetical protein [Lentzea sp. NBRC 105346]GLZ34773.1 hypothetical protein Lesp02_69600 [Lentzea sp. NBRC 105346]